MCSSAKCVGMSSSRTTYGIESGEILTCRSKLFDKRWQHFFAQLSGASCTGEATLSALPAIEDGNLGIGGDADKPWFRAEGHSLSEYGGEFAGTLSNGEDGSAVVHANDRANPVVEKDEIAGTEAKWPAEFQAPVSGIK